MDYMTTKEAAKLWGIKPRRVQHFCESGKIEAERLGHIWIIAKDTPRPIDGRTKTAKAQKE